jgi:hypothetical protein
MVPAANQQLLSTKNKQYKSTSLLLIEPDFCTDTQFFKKQPYSLHQNRYNLVNILVSKSNKQYLYRVRQIRMIDPQYHLTFLDNITIRSTAVDLRQCGQSGQWAVCPRW